MFRSILEEIIGFVLPASCLSCEEPISVQEKFLCVNCIQKLENYEDTHPWKEEMKSAGVIDNSISAFWFREGTPIQPLLHAMKYQKMKSVGVMLGKELGRKITRLNGIKFDFVIPVPLHKARFRERTYNQCEYIARGISAETGAKVLNDAVIRTRFTPTQTKLNRQERIENVMGAFGVNPKFAEILNGRKIILADDVITTGATILECAKVLHKAGTEIIWVCSSAYAELKTENTKTETIK
jgi:ComF family protein